MQSGKIKYILLIFLLPILYGCSPKIVKPNTVDSIRVEIRDRIIHDTAYFEMPYIEKINVTTDTVSHLENKYAKSDAVMSNGILYHTLETIPQRLSMNVNISVRDTIIMQNRSQTITKEVNKLTKWQSFSMVLGWILGGLLIIVLVISFLKKKII